MLIVDTPSEINRLVRGARSEAAGGPGRFRGMGAVCPDPVTGKTYVVEAP